MNDKGIYLYYISKISIKLPHITIDINMNV